MFYRNVHKFVSYNFFKNINKSLDKQKCFKWEFFLDREGLISSLIFGVALDDKHYIPT